jgi:hypothetical protein
LAGAGFVDVSVRFTHQAADGMHSAVVQATKPALASAAVATISMAAAAAND